jgi:predicted ATP-dependent endonuclease of OLD family
MTYIKKFSVDYYRSLYNFNIDLDTLSIVIGRNSSGKSSVFKALQLLLDESASHHIDLQHDWSKLAPKTRFPRTFTFTATLQKGEDEYLIQRKICLNKKSAETSAFEFKRPDEQTWHQIGNKESKLIPSFYLFQPRTGALQDAFNPKEENNILTLIKAWLPEQLNDTSKLDNLMRGYQHKGTTLAAYYSFIKNEVTVPFKIAFPAYFGVTSLHPEYRHPIDRGKLFVRELNSDSDRKAILRLPLDHHGAGLTSAIAIVLSISVLQEYHRQKLNSKPLIVAIEEPEVHMHPHAQRTFLDYLRWASDKNQILASTHSPIFVDRTQPEHVIVLRRTTTSSQNHSLRAGTTVAVQRDYRDNWKELISELGIHLSDALMAGEVNLIVEGVTEAVLLPAMAKVLGQNGQDSIDFDRVFIVNGQGGNIPHIVRILQGFGNPTVVTVDNDGGGEEIRKSLSKLDPPVRIIKKPDFQQLLPPLNQSDKCEFEDLFDSKLLLEAFNEAFDGLNGYEFLPITYEEFMKMQSALRNKQKPFGWIATVESLIDEKATAKQLRDKKVGERVTKRRLAETAAEHVRDGRLPIPEYCIKLFCEIRTLLGT